MVHHLATKNLLVCVCYGLISILQTLNSRTLFKTFGFDFYSFIFGTQRIAMIFIFFFLFDIKFSWKRLLKILPYSAIMCINTVLSSYCLTIMPLAAFLSFKKLIILFLMALSYLLSLPFTTNHFQNLCVVGIVIGGVMVGQRDMLAGDIIGYTSCLIYNLSEATLLQLSAYLNKADKYEPSELQFYNAMISLPYYLGAILLEHESKDIIQYFQTNATIYFLLSFLLCIFLAIVSQFSASWIAMKISPFEKSTVSNIKDLLLTLISIYYFHDFIITWISGAGIAVCLVSSALFSIPFLEEEEKIPINSMDNEEDWDHDKMGNNEELSSQQSIEQSP